MKKAIFAGTFDPFTVGHEDTVKKSLALFDEVVIAVAENRKKQTLFSSEERREMISSVFEGEPVRVLVWEGTIAALLEKENTPFYVRGIRNSADFLYETDDLYATRDLNPKMIALYLPAEQRHTHISSSLVKNCISFGTPFDAYVPAAVREYILRRQHV